MGGEVPNLFFSGPWHVSTSANYPYMLDQLAIHVASILSEVDQEARSRNPCTQGYPRFVIEPFGEDEDAWAAEVLSRARGLARGKPCTPSYMNAVGSFDQMEPEKALQAARASIWGAGVKDFVETLEKWREFVDNLWVSYLEDNE